MYNYGFCLDPLLQRLEGGIQGALQAYEYGGLTGTRLLYNQVSFYSDDTRNLYLDYNQALDELENNLAEFFKI